jgi:hypothetical protein
VNFDVFGDRFLIRHFGCNARSACLRTISLDDEMHFVEAVAITVSYHSEPLTYCIWDARLKMNTALTPWLPLPEDFEGRKLVWERFMAITEERSWSNRKAEGDAVEADLGR